MDITLEDTHKIEALEHRIRRVQAEVRALRIRAEKNESEKR